MIEAPRHCIVSSQRLHYEKSNTLEKSYSSHDHSLNSNQKVKRVLALEE